MEKYQCELCDRRLSTQHTLRQHIAWHADVRLYSCEQCDSTFRQSSNLYRHVQRAHRSNAPYVCSVCSKRFKSDQNIRAHMIAHSGERKYGCTHCEKRFPRKSDLNRHANTHTHLRSYECPICKKNFSDSSCLRRHERKHNADSKTAAGAVEAANSSADREKPTIKSRQLLEQAHLLLEQAEQQLEDRPWPDAQPKVRQLVRTDKQQVAQQSDQSSRGVHCSAGQRRDEVSSEKTIACGSVVTNQTTLLGRACGGVEIGTQMEADFNSQAYYDWLLSYAESLRLCSTPLSREMYLRATQVLSAVHVRLCEADGPVLCYRENYEALTCVAENLAAVLRGHHEAVKLTLSLRLTGGACGTVNAAS